MSVAVDYSFFDRNTDKVILYFSGMGKEYHFYKTAEESKYSSILIKNNPPNFYTSDNFTDQLEDIKQKTTEKKLISIGVSMGGYGAIKCLNVLDIKKIILFSPQVEYLSDWHPWVEQGLRAESYIHLIKDIPVSIYFCKDNSVAGQKDFDTLEAQKVKEGAGRNIIINPVPCVGHKCAQWLKRKELLDDILEKEIKEC